MLGGRTRREEKESWLDINSAAGTRFEKAITATLQLPFCAAVVVQRGWETRTPGNPTSLSLGEGGARGPERTGRKEKHFP